MNRNTICVKQEFCQTRRGEYEPIDYLYCDFCIDAIGVCIPEQMGVFNRNFSNQYGRFDADRMS